MFAHDQLVALRTTRRSAGSSALAVLTLAFAIGASTALFATLDSVVLDPLPFRDSSRIVLLWRKAAEIGGSLLVNPTVGMLEHWRAEAETFDQIEGVKVTNPIWDGGPQGAETWTALRASPDFLRLAGRSPSRGRMFVAGEEAERPVLISHARWRRDYGGSDEVLGDTLRLDGEIHTIVGVLPRAFTLPVGPPEPVDALLPTSGEETSFHGLGRLAPGVTLEEATRELDFLLSQMDEGDASGGDASEGDAYTWRAAVMRPGDLLGTLPETLWTLLGCVAVVLLVACSNVAALMIGRFTTRRRELAVRSALGATRGRLVAQLLAESLLLAALGGGLGIAMAAAMIGLVQRLRPDGLEELQRAEVAGGALLFALALALGAALVIGLTPSLRGVRSLQPSDLKAGANSTLDRSQTRLRRALVVAQIALSFVLALAATLLVQRIQQLRALDLGFDSQHLALASIELPRHSFSSEASRSSFWEQAREAVARLPGVEGVAVTSGVPPRSSITVSTLEIEGIEIEQSKASTFFWTYQVETNYPKIAGLSFLSGAMWSDEEAAREGDGAPALVNASFARQHWGRLDVVGERLRLGTDSWRDIRGVVGDVRASGPASRLDAPQLYFPTSLDAAHRALAVRAAGDPEILVGSIRSALERLDQRALLSTVASVESLMWRSLAQQRFAFWLLGLFATGTLLLVFAGLYSVVSLGVEQRRKELALRLALGARGAEIGRLVLAGAATMAALGLTLGVALAVGGARLASSAIFGPEPPGAATYGLAALSVGVAVIAAVARPVLRAASIQPIRALREE